MLGMIRRYSLRIFFWYEIPLMNQIWYQFSIWYWFLTNMDMFTIVSPIVLALTLTPIITSILLSLSWLSRCGLLIMIMWLIMERKLLILGGSNIWIRIIWHESHWNHILRVDTRRHSTCLTFLFLRKAPMRLLIHN